MTRYSYSLRTSQRYNNPAEDIMNKALEAADTFQQRVKEIENAQAK